MPTSRAFIKTVSSVNLVFGLDWFAILGGAVSREVRRIARRHKATHAVHASDDAASVGITTLQSGKRGEVLYSAAQLVAQRFATGAVALVLRLDDGQWWLVAVHEGAVIARTDHVCTTLAEASALIGQLRQAYPALTVLDDEKGQPSVSELAAGLYTEAQLRRVATGSHALSRPFVWPVLVGLFVFLIHKAWTAIDFSDRGHSGANGIAPDVAWNTAISDTTRAHWIHGVTGTGDLLLSLYTLPVQLAGWRLLHIECASGRAQWLCHADYSRDDPDASNEHFLGAAPQEWDISFTPLEQLRVRWERTSKGLGLAQVKLQTGHDNERHLFSKLQAIRPAFALVKIDAPESLPVPVPTDEQGHAIPRPPGLPQFGTRAVRIQAPLRSLALLLPYCDAIAWHNVVISISPHIRPDLTHSRLNVTLQGTLYEQD